jgi:RNA polymerase sigma-70 factor (ECF subfamily)
MPQNKLHNLSQSEKKGAFAALLNRHHLKVLNTCFKFLLNKEDAEDVTQEVFIEVFQSINKFRGDAQVSTWIYRIAISKCLDEIKKRNRKKRISSIGKILGLEFAQDKKSNIAEPDITLEQKQHFELLQIALDKLPDTQRIAFTLSKIDGYSNEEIATIMETTIIAVESLVYRGRKKVKEGLENLMKQ